MHGKVIKCMEFFAYMMSTADDLTTHQQMKKHEGEKKMEKGTTHY